MLGTVTQMVVGPNLQPQKASDRTDVIFTYYDLNMSALHCRWVVVAKSPYLPTPHTILYPEWIDLRQQDPMLGPVTKWSLGLKGTLDPLTTNYLPLASPNHSTRTVLGPLSFGRHDLPYHIPRCRSAN